MRVEPVLRPSALTALKSSAYDAAGQGSRRLRLELCVADQHEHVRERQALRTHRSERRRCRPPLADGRAPRERGVARAEPVGRAPGEHGIRHLDSPFEPALDASLASALSSTRLVAIPATFGQRRERRGIARIQRRLLRREEADERRVRRSDDRRAARCARRSSTVNEDWCVAPLDAVVAHRRSPCARWPRAADWRSSACSSRSACR